MKKKEHIVKTVKPGSIAEELEIAPGDKVLAIDNTEIEDIFDYQFLTQDTYIEMLVEKPDGEQWLLEIDKEFDEDMGIEFENGLMDEYPEKGGHPQCRRNPYEWTNRALQGRKRWQGTGIQHPEADGISAKCGKCLGGAGRIIQVPGGIISVRAV